MLIKFLKNYEDLYMHYYGDDTGGGRGIRASRMATLYINIFKVLPRLGSQNILK